MPKLPKAPLQEAVFELRWDLDVAPDTQQEMDTGFELAQGKLQGLAAEEFPLIRRRAPSEFPTSLFNYKIVHQFWRGEGIFPVIQLGPGIFTVNDTEKNYDWEKAFFPLVKKSLGWLYQAYENNLQPNFINLRYIDSVNLPDYDFKGDWLAFIKKNLKIDLKNHFTHDGTLRHFNINQSFELEGGGELNITVSSGRSKQSEDPVLIWQTGVVDVGRFHREEILAKLQSAHRHTHELFLEMTKGAFYDSFR